MNNIPGVKRRGFFFPVSNIDSIHENIDEFSGSILIVENPVLDPRKHLIQPCHQGGDILDSVRDLDFPFFAGVILQMPADVD